MVTYNGYQHDEPNGDDGHQDRIGYVLESFERHDSLHCMTIRIVRNGTNQNYMAWSDLIF